MVKMPDLSGDNKGDRGQRPTMLQRLGFIDPDLKCPEHDKMSFALADHEFVKKLLHDAGLVTSKANAEEWLNKRAHDVDCHIVIELQEAPPRDTPGVLASILGPESKTYIGDPENPTKRYYTPTINRWVTGSATYKLLSGKLEVDVRLEVPVCKGQGEYKVIIGYADAIVSLDLVLECEKLLTYPDCRGGHTTETKAESLTISKTILVDAKPSIPNPMETLRQFNTYREHLADVHHLLWCPPCPENVKTIFQQQGIYVSCLPCP